MAHATETQLLALVRESRTVDELDERVCHQFGAAHLPGARLVAVREKGVEWVFGPIPNPSSEIYKTLRVLGRPTSIVLWLSSLIVLLILFWCPFEFVQGGTSWHMGFFLIFGEPSEARRGTVNVALLSLELLSIVGVSGALYLIAQRIEGRGSE